MKNTIPSFSLKDKLFNKGKVEYLSGLIKNTYIDFLDKEFEKEVLVKFPELELKQRISHISSNLRKYLPSDYKKALQILLLSLPDEIITEVEDNNFGDFIFCSYSVFVAIYGCNKEYLNISLDALEIITIRFSAEDAIRYFLNEFEEETFSRILKWSKSENYHLRRLSSEGTRAKLPWCKNINLDYRKTIEILDDLYFDSSRFVTRSVANHLNDISKINPDLVIETLKSWQKTNKSKDLSYIISHSTRSLVKLGNKNTLEFLGYSTKLQIEVTNFEIKKIELSIGESLEFSFVIIGNKEENLIIDYKIHFVGKNGKLLPKVFKIKKIKNFLGNLQIIKKHTFKIMSTKNLYSGKHFLEIVINGKNFIKKDFELVI